MLAGLPHRDRCLNTGEVTDVSEDTGGDSLRAVEKVVGAGDAVRVGWFRMEFADQRWEWSDEMARLHGYEPGDVEPSTELLLSHKHPDDRDRVEAELVTSVRDHAPFSSRHRIIDTDGDEHQVVVVSEPITDDDGIVIGTGGYCVDLTDSLPESVDLLGEVLPEIVEQRAAIEQAKGILMAIYALSPDQAFQVLRWRSQVTNTKLRDLSAALVAATTATPPMDVRARTRFDHILLTVHERIIDNR
ncbi:putative diguanylate cyclase [Nocardia otitidiscaviarum]|uniref:histidine kinase n=1 Tax=Nocardia otitidiscaviarum TaxID=1823 RepID=A0A379JIS7_9NOCA|nr:putative diguanylate cyclase [Nocardia otitidiscaviarum]